MDVRTDFGGKYGCGGGFLPEISGKIRSFFCISGYEKSTLSIPAIPNRERAKQEASPMVADGISMLRPIWRIFSDSIFPTRTLNLRKITINGHLHAESRAVDCRAVNGTGTWDGTKRTSGMEWAIKNGRRTTGAAKRGIGGKSVFLQ
jgi:hypothetical protein